MPSGSGAIAPSWSIQGIRLRYRLGPITIRRHQLKFAVLDAPFTGLGLEPEAIRPPFREWSKDVDGALVSGHPVAPGVTLPRIAVLPEAIRYVPTQTVRYYADLTGTFEQYLDKFSSKTRATLRRKVRKLAEAGGGAVDFRQYRTQDAMDEFYRHARAVAEKTYQERLLDAALPATPEFQVELGRLAAEGKVRAYLLFFNGQPIAYLYCPIKGRSVIYEHLGYDPAYKALSPGTVLQYLAVEQLFAEGGFTVFDFTEGEGQHKQMFSTASVRCANVFFFRRTLLNAWLVGVHVALSEATRGAGAFLEALGVRGRLRKFLRSGAAQ
jgi:CelD/BcsL family acetyltransferase involved in cellulose biosynthesis